MAFLTYIVVGTLFCVLAPGRVDAAGYRGFDDGVGKSENDGTQDQQMPPATTDRRTTMATQEEEKVKVFPSEGPWKARFGTPSGAETQVTFHSADAKARSAAQESVRFVGHRVWNGEAKSRQRWSASGIYEGLRHQYNLAGLNSVGTTRNSSGSVNAGSAQGFPFVRPSLTVAAMNDSSLMGVAHSHSARSDVLVSPRSLSESDDFDGPYDDADGDVLRLLIKAGLIEPLLQEEHYRLLAISYFTKRALSYHDRFGQYPKDKVLERFFRAAEAGILEDELEDETTRQLFLYCMHLDLGDMTQGYLFHEATDVFPPTTTTDFEATLDMFRHVVQTGSLNATLENEAQRYLFYRFYAALEKRTGAQGTERELPNPDKYIVNLVSSGVLQTDLETAEGRQHIVNIITSEPGILTGLPLPPPNRPTPPSPPPETPPVPPDPDDPKADTPTPLPNPPQPPPSAATHLNFSVWLSLLLALGVVVASV